MAAASSSTGDVGVLGDRPWDELRPALLVERPRENGAACDIDMDEGAEEDEPPELCVGGGGPGGAGGGKPAAPRAMSV